MDNTSLIIWSIIGVNIVSFLLMAIDKRKAKKHAWRISERTFWMISIFGGAIGTFLGMKQYRHKTKHWSFTIGIPMLIILQGAFLLAVAFLS
ncbi:DUF1294 domain-containing protein [Lentibacillus halophilus]|uniref:DUF1294 domain-containing protein n=1 Tax=Lentibacillus halophilus TaxID=295065 RepID=A0ABP3IXT8_9BACI